MTYHNTTSGDPVDRPANEPTGEIEVTPEMAEAGARVLCAFETFTAGEAYWAEEVYRAMEHARIMGGRATLVARSLIMDKQEVSTKDSDPSLHHDQERQWVREVREIAGKWITVGWWSSATAGWPPPPLCPSYDKSDSAH